MKKHQERSVRLESIWRVVSGDPMTPEKVSRRIGMSNSSCSRYLADLMYAGRLGRRRSGNGSEYEYYRKGMEPPPRVVVQSGRLRSTSTTLKSQVYEYLRTAESPATQVAIANAVRIQSASAGRALRALREEEKVCRTRNYVGDEYRYWSTHYRETLGSSRRVAQDYQANLP